MTQYAALGRGAPTRDGPRWSPKDHGDIDTPESPISDTRLIRNERFSLQDSVGTVRVCILIIGTVFIFAAAILLALLWAGAATARAQEDPGQAWRFVVNQGWAPMTVTICVAIIRVAMSLQAGVIMSMIAAVLVERHQFELGDGIFLSIVRAVSVQPVNFFFTGGRNLWKMSGLAGFPLILTTSLIALISTFTSSILLSDFGNIKMLGDLRLSSIGFTNDYIDSAVEIWRSPPAQYARFAEYADGSRAVGEHVDDTGITLRAPLPMAASEEREALRSYTGPATVFDQRVICVAPQLTLFSINKTSSSAGSFFGHLSLGGNATFENNLPPPLWIDPSQPEQISFNCAFSKLTFGRSMPSNVTVCSIKQPSDYYFPLRITPWLNTSDTERFIKRPSLFFVLNVTAPMMQSGRMWTGFTDAYLRDVNGTSPVGFAFPQGSIVTSKEGPWTAARVQGIPSMDDATFSLTACIANTAGLPFNITATSPSDGPEPTLGWSGVLLPDQKQQQQQQNPSPLDLEKNPQYQYNTTLVRRQLNALGPAAPSLSLSDRGVMALVLSATNFSSPLPARDLAGYVSLRTDELFPTFPILPGIPPLCVASGGCATDPSAVLASVGAVRDVGHPVHLALFLDALRETRSPARAVQSWITTMTRQRFYDSLARFTSGGEARYAQSVAVFVPCRWGGFVLVAGVLVVHLVVVGVVVAWYWRVTRHTVLGDSWQAVAQVVSDATLPVLWSATGGKGDEGVRGWRRERGLGGGKYRLARRSKTGRRELVVFAGE